jgi:hypothetical protein
MGVNLSKGNFGPGESRQLISISFQGIFENFSPRCFLSLAIGAGRRFRGGVGMNGAKIVRRPCLARLLSVLGASSMCAQHIAP